MARTKNQAIAGRGESAQRSTAVNEREGSRVGTSTAGADGGDEANNASSSERARRAANRGRADGQETTATAIREAGIIPPTHEGSGRGGGHAAGDDAHVVKERKASGSGSAMLAHGAESDN